MRMGKVPGRGTAIRPREGGLGDRLQLNRIDGRVKRRGGEAVAPPPADPRRGVELNRRASAARPGSTCGVAVESAAGRGSGWPVRASIARLRRTLAPM